MDERLEAMYRGRFADRMGVRILEATPERVTGEMLVGDEHTTVPGRAHGGAIMSFADTLGAMGTILNLPDGAGTSTIESKANFFSAAPTGQKIFGESTPLHRGRTTQVWQTRITREDGKLCAQVTQTQIVLLWGDR
jgi:uncharacterized protein (TIGR00369 family)